MRLVLGFCLLAIIACAGGEETPPVPDAAEPAAPPEVVPPTPVPSAGAVSVSVESTPEGPAGEPPMSTLVLASGAETFRVGPYSGNCSPGEPLAGAIAVFNCWWAGAGSNVKVVQGADGLEVWTQETAEELSEPMPWVRGWSQKGAAAPAGADLRTFLQDIPDHYGWQTPGNPESLDFFPDGRLHVQGPDGEASMYEGTWKLEGSTLTVLIDGRPPATYTAVQDGDRLLLNGTPWTRYKP